MSGRDDIVIVYAYLESMARNCARVADALDSGSAMSSLTFEGTPRVTDAYQDFLDRWDQHRRRLHEGIGAAGEAFTAVRDAFVACEDELIAALDGD